MEWTECKLEKVMLEGFKFLSLRLKISKCVKRIQNSVQTSKIEHIVKIVIVLINSILDVRLALEYTSKTFF